MLKSAYKSNVESIIKDYELLSTNEVVGIYNRCEFIEIFGFDKSTKEAFNIFTLIIFEKSQEVEVSEKFLTTDGLKNFKGHKNINWGISRKILSVEQCREFFLNLINKNVFKSSDKELKIGNIEFQNKSFVPKGSVHKKVQLNDILKNNFKCGSYIIEGFDIKKSKLKFLLDNPILLNEFGEEISEIIPIKTSNLSDRLGNIIFQFPINVFNTYINRIESNLGVNINLNYNKELKSIPDLQVVGDNSLDGIVFDTVLEEFINNKDIIFSVSDEINIRLYNKKYNLILYADTFIYSKSFKFYSIVNSQQDRIFMQNGKQINVSISSNEMSLYDNGMITKDDWIHNRKYEQELKELENNGSFIQYFGNQEEKALTDLRNLINKYSSNGVYLWDPFLNVSDIKNTLYYTPYSNVPLRAITNLKDVNSTSKTTNFDKVKTEFEVDDKEYLLIDLEVRSKQNGYGSDFHDRFLIFPLEKPKVWSLGTSVNSLGKSHHILQEVKHAQHILNAFNKLWDELNHKECIVWKSK